jgi:hypothetical protein
MTRGYPFLLELLLYSKFYLFGISLDPIGVDMRRDEEDIRQFADRHHLDLAHLLKLLILTFHLPSMPQDIKFKPICYEPLQKPILSTPILILRIV